MKNNSFRLILTALFASMVCVCTMFVQIASPTGGYINLGDAMVLMGAFLLGPAYGAAAAGIGSALADLLAGYVNYALGTLIIKALVALVAGLLARTLAKRAPNLKQPLRCVVAAIPAELIMILGYFLYAFGPLGYGAAAVGEILGNTAQATAGIVISAILTPLVSRPKEIREMLDKFTN